MNKEAISWDTAPEYGYKGYRYMPHLDEAKDEQGNVKGVHVWHDIYNHYDCENAQSRGGYVKPAMTTNMHQNRFLTEQEFKDFIDYMERVTE